MNEQHRQPSLEGAIDAPLHRCQEPKKRKRESTELEFPRPTTAGSQFCHWDNVDSSANADAKPARRRHRQKAMGAASGDTAGGLAVHPCPVCGKRFRSLRSLFGHMRCHPERQWRGITPPPNFRSPGPLPTPDPRPEPSVGAEEEEVARSLIMLSTTSSSSAAAAGAGSQAPVPDDGLLLSLSLDPPQPTCCFLCRTCNKDFRSRLALDGHRASHENTEGCHLRHGEDEHGEKTTDACGGDGSYEIDHERMTKIMGHHGCSMCLRVFPTGQALNMHKRCHRGRNEQQKQLLHQKRSTIEKNCVLSLNLPVPDDMEEGCNHDLDLDLKLGGGSEVGESGLDGR